MSLLSTLSALAQSVHAHERALRLAVGLPDAPQAPADCLDACARLERTALECEAAVRGRLGAPAEAPAAAGRLGVPGRPVPNGAAYRLPEEQGPPAVALEKMTVVEAPAVSLPPAWEDGPNAPAVGAGGEEGLGDEVMAASQVLLGAPNGAEADKAPPAPADGARKAKGKKR